MRTKRICAGAYKVVEGINTVHIDFHEQCQGWIASADWDNHLYTDPLPTKRDAVECAQIMLVEGRA